MFTFSKSLLVGAVALASSQLVAQELNADKKIDGALQTLGLKAEAIADTPVDGLLQVVTDRGLFYVGKDGKTLMQGKMYGLNNGGVENLTEKALSKVRKEGISKFDDSMIVFPAKNEKHQVTVFTDTSCGYCRRLHNQMQEYNDLGITVRYMAFPRAGVGSKIYDDMMAVWCAKDPKKAMTDAKSGDEVAAKSCKQPLDEHYAMGQRVGVNGTPAIVLEDGSMIPGYQPPAQLAKILETL